MWHNEKGPRNICCSTQRASCVFCTENRLKILPPQRKSLYDAAKALRDAKGSPSQHWAPAFGPACLALTSHMATNFLLLNPLSDRCAVIWSPKIWALHKACTFVQHFVCFLKLFHVLYAYHWFRLASLWHKHGKCHDAIFRVKYLEQRVWGSWTSSTLRFKPATSSLWDLGQVTTFSESQISGLKNWGNNVVCRDFTVNWMRCKYEALTVVRGHSRWSAGKN